MRHGVHVGAGAENLAMEEHLGRRLQPLASRHRLAVEIAHQEIAGTQRCAALVEGLDEEQIAPRQARADMAAISQDVEIVEEQRAGGDLLAQRGFGIGHGVSPICARAR